MSNLFLSYRRSDSPGTVKTLHERLKARLPRWTLFYDHKGLAPGEDFPERLRLEVASAKIVLVVIGPRWVESLTQRLNSAQVDHVRGEVRLALHAGNTVVPLLVENARMPSEADLASFPDLLPLLRLNGRTVRPDPDFDTDLERLAAYLDERGPGVGPGTLLAGKYKILREVGQGGMGVVYEAEQQVPRRIVAVKMILEGMDTKEVLARFDGEKEALARMDHPHIARVIDCGSSPAGKPYFVMEFVKGEPITTYCDRKRLTPAARLGLFRSVCSAVQHAHQKGIIHRDIKPSNVLVEEADGQPVPKVIDFGLAKALAGRLTDQTFASETGHTVGTLLYSSPEQAAGLQNYIDTRTDIYSLGVLLYELLAGVPPFTEAELQQVGDDAMRRQIIEAELSLPSTKLSSSHALPSIAANRQLEPAKLTRLIRGELDWIVMRALEKEPQRRYATAVQLADDVERYLTNEPVTARKPTRLYTLKKLLRRNRGAVIAGSLVVLALVGGIVGTTIGLLQADDARKQESVRAEGERVAKEDAVHQKAVAVAAEQVATRRLANVEKANTIMASIFENLDPKEIAKAERPLQAILMDKIDAAIKLLDVDSIGDELVVADMQEKLGKSLLSLGEPLRAITVLERCRAIRSAKLGPDHHDTLTSINNIASSYESAGKTDLAMPLFVKTLALRKAKLGPDHHDTLLSMNNLANCYDLAGKLDLSLPLFEETLALMKAKLGLDHPDTLACMGNLALSYKSAGKLDRALPLYEETLAIKKVKLGLDHPSTLTNMNNLALGYKAAGKLDQALPLLEATLAIMKAKLGPDHPDTLTNMNNLALSYQSAGKLDRALLLYDETFALSKAKLGSDHPDTLISMANLALGYQSTGKLDRALPLLKEIFLLMKAKLGPDHSSTLASMNNLALGYNSAGRLDLALPLFQETLIIRKVKLGPDHPLTLGSMNNLAAVYLSARNLDAALPLFEETLTLKKAKLGLDHPDTLNSMNNLASAYLTAGKLDHALPLYEQAAIGMEKRNYLHSNAETILTNTMRVYESNKQYEKAESWHRKWLAHVKTKSGSLSAAYAAELAGLAVNLLRQAKYTDAETICAECIAIRKSIQPEAWATFNTQSMLGEALMMQQKHADAEPQLLAGYDGLKAREKQIPPGTNRLREAAERLVRFYEMTGQPLKVKEWQAKVPRESAPVPRNGR